MSTKTFSCSAPDETSVSNVPYWHLSHGNKNLPAQNNCSGRAVETANVQPTQGYHYQNDFQFSQLSQNGFIWNPMEHYFLRYTKKDLYFNPITLKDILIVNLVELKLLFASRTSIGSITTMPVVTPQNPSCLLLSMSAYDDLGVVSPNYAQNPQNPGDEPTACARILQKAYSLAAHFELDTKNAFNNPVDSWFYNDCYYGISCKDHSDTLGIGGIIAVQGEKNAILENWQVIRHPYASKDIVAPATFVRDIDGRIRLLNLPRKKHYLQGLFPAYGDHDAERILTPSYGCWWKNRCQPGKRYITWLGGNEALDKTDWSPLDGKSVTYRVSPDDFTTIDQCLSCMKDVCELLDKNGCRVKIMVIEQINDREVLKCDIQDMYKVYKIFNRSVPVGMVDYDALLAPPPAYVAPQPLVTRMINRKDITIVYGAAGTGKSFFLDSLAYALTRGKDLCDRFPIQEPQSVLVLNGEMTPEEIGKRNCIYERMYGKEGEKAFLKTLPFQQEKLDTPEGIRLLSDLIGHANRNNDGKKPVSLVILDSLKTLTTAGDGQKGWNTLFENLNKLREDYGVAFIVVHHTNKEERSYGTIDTTVKVESELFLTHDVERAILPDCLAIDEEYAKHLGSRVAEWQMQHQDDIWFFVVSGKVRSGKKSDRRTVLMHMCPEDETPKWQCIDYLEPSHEWSPKPKAEDEKNEKRSVEDPSETSAGTVISSSPQVITTLADMSGWTREQVLDVLHGSYIAGNTTREMIGKAFSTNKNGIDYLAKKYEFTNKDFMYSNETI